MNNMFGLCYVCLCHVYVQVHVTRTCTCTMAQSAYTCTCICIGTCYSYMFTCTCISARFQQENCKTTGIALPKSFSLESVVLYVTVHVH